MDAGDDGDLRQQVAVDRPVPSTSVPVGTGARNADVEDGLRALERERARRRRCGLDGPDAAREPHLPTELLPRWRRRRGRASIGSRSDPTSARGALRRAARAGTPDDEVPGEPLLVRRREVDPKTAASRGRARSSAGAPARRRNARALPTSRRSRRRPRWSSTQPAARAFFTQLRSPWGRRASARRRPGRSRPASTTVGRWSGRGTVSRCVRGPVSPHRASGRTSTEAPSPQALAIGQGEPATARVLSNDEAPPFRAASKHGEPTLVSEAAAGDALP